MAAITVAFIAGLLGAFVVRSAKAADGRLIIAGFRPVETLVPRLAVIGSGTALVLVVSLAVTALSFSPASWPAFIVGNVLVGVLYAEIGAIAGALLGLLGAAYLVLFAAMLSFGILQNPMFGDGSPGGVAVVLPDYGAGAPRHRRRVLGGLRRMGELALAVSWLGIAAVAVAFVMRRLLGTGGG